MKVCLFALLIFPLLAFAQQPPSTTAQNLLRNGDFERFAEEDNLWDGVDRDGFLSGDASGENIKGKRGEPRPAGLFFSRQNRRWTGIDVALDGGNLTRLPVPVSVQAADLNQDGLLDLITVDTTGYFRVYFNSGSPTQPVFTHCELVPVFLGRFRWPDQKTAYRWRHPGRHYGDALKLALADFSKNGTPDLLLGNYYGNLMLIRNTGSPQAPEWRQPGAIESIQLPTTKDGRLWANLLAPAVYDWNNDNKLDVLVGEGSYSANAVHLLANLSGATGAFASNFAAVALNAEYKEYLAYGDGREQLIPAVVDYNRDGIPDLIVGDRSGQIHVYLSEGPWKKGGELKRQPAPISFGRVTHIGNGPVELRCVAPAVGDLNGDGKFDIIVGKADGHIAVSYNIGTPTEPKFGPMMDLKGEKVFPRGSIRSPADWWIEFGLYQGNFLGYYSVVSPQEDPQADQANGKQVLKFGYAPSLNKIIRRAPMIFPGDPSYVAKAGAWFHPDGVRPNYWGGKIAWEPWYTDSNTLILRQEPGWNVVMPNKRYTISFRVKGRNVKNGRVLFALGGWLLRDTQAAQAQPNSKELRANEVLQEEFDFSVGSTWGQVTRSITFKFNQADLNAFEKWNKPSSSIKYFSLLNLRASLMSEDAVLYIDDVKLTPM